MTERNQTRIRQEQARAFFWNLDADVPLAQVREYQEALQGKTASTLSRWVQLLEAKIPTPPRAYVSSAFAMSLPQKIPEGFALQLDQLVTRFERLTHTSFGGTENPLLLTVEGDYCGSVRNIGVSLHSLRGLVHHYGAPKAFALYADFLESYSTLVLGCPHIDFRQSFNIAVDREGGAGGLAELSIEKFVEHIRQYQEMVSVKTRKPFPEAPPKHLLSSLIQCACTGKQAGGDELFLTAQVHASSFGKSIEGVAYTRNPFTGASTVYGAFRAGEGNQRGPLEPDTGGTGTGSGKSLRERFPETYSLIKKHLPAIETSYRDVVEAEFVTDEDGRLYFVGFDKAQTTARATAIANLELALAGKISDREAALRIHPSDIEVLLHPTLDENSREKLEDVGFSGTTASPGTAVGHLFFRMSDAMEFHRNAVREKKDSRVILIANELLISDTPGLGVISGLVTRASGIASHAAVMARANGIPCIVGYKGFDSEITEKAVTLKNGKTLRAGTLITIEADKEAHIYLGEGKLHDLSYQDGIVRDISQLLTRVIREKAIPLDVRVNINSPKDAEVGLKFGADGVGLCRTENMFMEAEALREVRNIIFSNDPTATRPSLDKLEENQFQQFQKILEVMRGRPVNIRLMDLPLNDFVPKTQQDLDELIRQLPHLNHARIQAQAATFREQNPMLGLRGARFGLINPEIYEMQIRAIIRAAYTLAIRDIDVNPGIMLPLVFTQGEIAKLRARVVELEEKIRISLNLPFTKKIKIRVGSMIELPAAALATGDLAREGEFFAFGTNDLTQTALGISRDDSSHYLPYYIEHGILPADPFKALSAPVKELLQISVHRGRRVRQDAKFGICGEQAGDRGTVEFCLENAINYVSCSPVRVLPTRAELVHATLGANNEKTFAEQTSENRMERRDAPRHSQSLTNQNSNPSAVRD